MSEVTFHTSQLSELDLNLINLLLTQAIQSPENREHVVRACKFVLTKLEEL